MAKLVPQMSCPDPSRYLLCSFMTTKCGLPEPTDNLTERLSTAVIGKLWILFIHFAFFPTS